jgi:hypothetical protein
MRTFVTMLLALVVASGCGGGKKKAAPAGSVDGLMSRLSAAGLAPNKLTAVEVPTLAGGKCQRGDVSGVEMTVCDYADAAKAKGAESQGLSLVGDNTGASLASGSMLLVVADRKGIDKDGKKIDQITRAFRGN